MSAFDCLERLSNTSLIFSDLKYCLVSEKKVPFRIDNEPARPNELYDFVDFEELLQHTSLDSYAGIGISIQASNISAIDVDKCFSIPNDISSADERAKDIMSLFKDKAYYEFSFSGTGLRVLFRLPLISDYASKYYIKNKKVEMEFYQPNRSFRYVTLTGNVIQDRDIDKEIDLSKEVFTFLDKYMKRAKHQIISQTITSEKETRSFEELKAQVRIHYFNNSRFQDVWFSQAPGSGKDESERDFFLLSYLFENITQDKELLKQLFESSYFFKSKDSKHKYKWTNCEFRYYNYLYNLIRSTHQ